MSDGRGLRGAGPAADRSAVDPSAGRSAGRSGEITGLGAVTPIGVGVGPFVAALRRGESGTRPLPFEHPLMRSTVAAGCPGFEPGAHVAPAELEKLPRLVPMALAAAREALRASGLPMDDTGATLEGRGQLSRRVGLILGTGGGGADFTIGQTALMAAGKRPSLWTITNATHGNLAGELSIRLGLRGPSQCVSTGCASSSDAAALALDQLRAGRAGSPDAWVVVGADAPITAETLMGMELLKVISTRDGRGDPAEAARACRPFDLDRDGFVLGEGAWAVVLERPGWRADAGLPEAAPAATLLGAGSTCDAFHRVRPEPDMVECARAIRLALADARLGPAELDLVQYHGTGTRANDEHETRAFKKALPEDAARLAGSSVKSMIGHPQGAGGLAGLVATVAAARGLDGGPPFVHPTINLDRPDPACDLDATPNRPRPLDPGRPHHALISCLAFGGKNTMLTLRIPPV